MHERRPLGYPRRAGAKIYYPSGKSRDNRRDEFDAAGRSRRPAFSFGESLLKKRFRPHSDGGKKSPAAKRFRNHRSDRKVPEESVRRTVTPAETEPASVRPRPETVSVERRSVPQERQFPPYPYPVPPFFQPPPPPHPPYPYGPYDEYGRRLSEEELAELYAREDFEDKYGRDFDRYADSPPTVSERTEVLPRNYLVEDEDGQ